MSQKIYKKDGMLVMEVPLISHRSNPWDENMHEPMNNLIGVICGHEVGFCVQIDMDYKDKPDQIGDFVFKWYGDDEKFRELCKDLDMDFFEYSMCDNCHKPCFGTFTMNEKGKQCFSCELEAKK